MALLIAPNNPAIKYSPYNWAHPNSATAVANNSAAEQSLLFTGTTCALNFNLTSLSSVLPQIWYRINSFNGSWTKATLATTISCAFPTDTISATNAESPTINLIEWIVKSTTETGNRWADTGQGWPAASVPFTGYTIDSGAAVYLPAAMAKNILMLGTSLTEGVRVMGQVAASGNDVDVVDGLQGWAINAGKACGANVGVVGFGGSGLTVVGSGGVPILPSSYGYIYAGQQRSFTPEPDLIWIDAGYNDGTNNTTSAVTQLLNSLLASCPGTPIGWMMEFPLASNSPQKTFIPAGIAACNNPGLVTYFDTTGVWNSAWSSDAIHPFGVQNTGLLTPYIAGKMNFLMNKSSPKFRGGGIGVF